LHICSCSENRVVNKEELLYVGGINPLSLTNVNASGTDFVGAIRNVVIGRSQVNLRCPQEEENTLISKNQKILIIKNHGFTELVMMISTILYLQRFDDQICAKRSC
jgi:hydroxylamine reductase (hybrid-cluster protein)